MAFENNFIQSVKFYETGKTFFSLTVVFNKQWKKYSIHLKRIYSYTQDDVTKQSSNTIFLSLTSAAELIGQLKPAYRLSKQLEDHESVNLIL